MNRRRCLQIIKWITTTATVLLTIGWLASAWYVFIYKTSGGTALSLSSGQFGISHTSSGLLQPGTEFRENDDPFEWWFTWVSLKKLWFLLIPLWFPLLLIATPTAFLWYKDHRKKLQGKRPNCGYTSQGLPPNSLCPECGKS